MREFVKVVCALVIMVSVLIGAVAWFDDRPDQTTWLLRTIPIGLAAAALAAFLVIHLKRDLAPDLLAERVGKYFERDGFCFHVVPDVVDEVCVFRLFFQNRFEQRCLARVALRPVEFLGSAPETLAYFTINCPGGAFGVADKPVGLPMRWQGSNVHFDVGADVEYPDGRGRQLRFRNAIVLRRNTDFVDSFARRTFWLGLLGGLLVSRRPARAKFVMPHGVATDLDYRISDRPKILWELSETTAQPV